jgi:hypothetical protein
LSQLLDVPVHIFQFLVFLLETFLYLQPTFISRSLLTATPSNYAVRSQPTSTTFQSWITWRAFISSTASCCTSSVISRPCCIFQLSTSRNLLQIARQKCHPLILQCTCEHLSTSSSKVFT